MKGKILIDTNILIYLFSNTEPKKQTVCQELIAKLSNESELVWSTQVVQEFCYNLIGKRQQKTAFVKKALSLFSSFELVVNDLMIIENAMDIQLRNQLSFWDSLIISSAVSAKCSYLLSEDLQHSQKIEGVEIVNPFLI
ncbi:PIN domain-containing protein [Ekhidna sp.]|uniref:PIN domain-containing protein n=1 Tax=Ekhidna sp. TaxID=2608089 RepID=UPI003CCBECCB